MNRELIKKYKVEFDHWLNGGKILYASYDIDEKKYSAWYNVPHNNNWDYSNVYRFKFIINDEYVEFRKALAEGKNIQYKDREGFWNKIVYKLEEYHLEELRIKPEEPKFKVGDWVKTIDGAVIKLDWVDKPGVLSNLYDYGIFGKDNCKLSYQNEVTSWQPQPGAPI